MSSPSPLPCGLTNLGNTCFLNSCVQLLNYTRELKDVPHDKVSDNPSTSLDHDVFREWRELRDMMLDVRGKMPSPVATPVKFVKMIHDIARIKGRDLFTGWAQNDLTEFLLFMIECIHTSRKRSTQMNIRGSSESTTDDLALQCYSMLKDNYARGEFSELSTIFHGVYVSRLFTPDGNTLHSNKPESFCLLDLPIPTLNNSNTSSIITILDCFDEFVADELLSGWFNEKENRKEPVRKNITFWSFPNVLIVTLKRFSPDGVRKNEVLVDFPLDILDLSKYVVGYRAKTYKYKLFGVANHIGSIMGGHYTSFVMAEDDKWYCFNDSAVSELPNPNVVVSPAAYCLFYRKI